MKAITVWQPWAWLWATGVKRYETRGWPARYAGPLAIHAGKKALTREDCEYWLLPRTRVLLAQSGLARLADLPLGAVLAVCDKVVCYRTDHLGSGFGRTGQRLTISDEERLMGDFSEGRWFWEPVNLRMLPEPVPAVGSQGLWDWEPPESVKRWLEGER